MKKIILFLLVVSLIIFGLESVSFAQDELTIVISGQSHASLYPCSCPYNPIGGVTRRATAIKEIRSKHKNVLILESGGSFAGGNHDANTQTSELDKERTRLYMQSLDEMGYDAFLVSSKEFNFGDNFLEEVVSGYKLNYLSANLEGDFIPYLIKEFGNIKVAIIGITDEKVTSQTQKRYTAAEESLSEQIKEIKDNQKANLIVVLSHLDEKQSKDIIGKTQGIDIWVSSNNPFKTSSNQDFNGTLLIVPAWEARKLTKINLDISTLDVKNIEHIELNSDIKDDAKVAGIIPGCFTDKNCRKTGFIAKCQNPGTKKSKCNYSRIKPIKLTVIKPRVCKTCNIEVIIERIEQVLPNLKIQYLDANNKPAKDLIKKLNIKMLPAYLIEDPQEEGVVSKIAQIAKKIDNYYVLEPGFTGVSFIAGRKKIPNRLDLFFDIGSKDIVKILDVLQEFKNKREDIDVHLNFLAVQDPELGLIAKGEQYEIEEFLRSACISKYYPDKLWYYLSCRLPNVGSSWWDDCIVKFEMDPGKIKGCARTSEGKILLNKFIKLTQELEVVFGPTFLINNQEIFSSEGAPTIEELESFFSTEGGSASGGQ